MFYILMKSLPKVTENSQHLFSEVQPKLQELLTEPICFRKKNNTLTGLRFFFFYESLKDCQKLGNSQMNIFYKENSFCLFCKDTVCYKER